eukprot:206220-Rhodomonas_salina.1
MSSSQTENLSPLELNAVYDALSNHDDVHKAGERDGSWTPPSGEDLADLVPNSGTIAAVSHQIPPKQRPMSSGVRQVDTKLRTATGRKSKDNFARIQRKDDASPLPVQVQKFPGHKITEKVPKATATLDGTW